MSIDAAMALADATFWTGFVVGIGVGCAALALSIMLWGGFDLSGPE